MAENRSPEPGQRPETPNRARLFAIATAAAVVVSILLLASPGPDKVPFSRFMLALDEGRVATVAIDEKTVVWQESPDETAARYRANRVPGVDDAVVVTRLH